jgi:hypothetical protein
MAIGKAIRTMEAVVARRKSPLPGEVPITADVAIGPMTGKPGAFSISAGLAVKLRGMQRAALGQLAAAAPEWRPHGNATPQQRGRDAQRRLTPLQGRGAEAGACGGAARRRPGTAPG